MPLRPTALLAFLLPSLLLVGCTDKAAAVDDNDGDGVDSTSDCDDSDDLIHPGAAEACDGLDNDCNGIIDDGVTTNWFVDGDGDSFGESGIPVTACQAPAGYVALDGDCDDADAAVFPGAPELCNTIDDDCDGATDSGEGAYWYDDGDGDGYGVDGTEVELCYTPEDMVAEGGDCDDTDPTLSPGAAEVCGDFDDDDCDGLSDVGVEGVWYSDDDSDGYGHPGEYETTCEPLAGWVDQGGDCRPTEAERYPGAPETCNDLDDNCDGNIDEDVFGCAAEPEPIGYGGDYDLGAADAHVYSSNASYGAGLLMETGDPTGDGIPDVLVSTLYANSYGGGGYVIEGPLSGDETMEDAGHRVYGTSSLTYGAGRSIGLGDVTGDGIDDVGFGAPYGSFAGMYIEFGPITGDRALASPDAWLECRSSIYCGHGGNLGDINGDGVADALVGAYAESSGASYGGAVYVVHGPITGDLDLSTDATKVSGNVATSYTGRFIQVEGDFNGDGLGDAMVAAPYATGSAPTSGVVYVLSGPISITSMASATARLLGPGLAGYLGEGAPMAGADIDLDGYDDAAVGSYTTAGRSYAGGVYVALGPVSGDIALTGADITIEGQTSTEHAGSCVGFGDSNDDGFIEVVVGAMSNSSGSGYGGATYLFTGLTAGTYTTADADASFYGAVFNSYAGSSCVLADMNHDGQKDVVAGAYNDNTGAGTGGGVFTQFAD
jgi:Putative metal-binding motif/FG-GAP repeat